MHRTEIKRKEPAIGGVAFLQQRKAKLTNNNNFCYIFTITITIDGWINMIVNRYHEHT